MTESDFPTTSKAIRWDAEGAYTLLGEIGPVSGLIESNAAYDINSSNVAVGVAGYINASGVARDTYPARWAADGSLTLLQTYGPGTSGYVSGQASRINEGGYTAGYVSKIVGSSNYSRAVRWAPDGALFELANLTTNVSENFTSRATDINASNQVVGTIQAAQTDVVRWDANGNATALRSPTGASVGSPLPTAGKPAINDSGYVIAGAYAWRPDNSPIALSTILANDPGWSNPTSLSISSSGWISGFGSYRPVGGSISSTYPRQFVLRLHAAAPSLTAEFDQVGALSIDAPTAAFALAEQGHVTLDLPAGGPLELALDLAGTGNIASAIADLGFVALGQYEVLPAVQFPGYDVVLRFTGSSGANAFSWDFLGLDVGVTAVAVVPEPAGLSLLLAAVPALRRRR